MKYFCYYKAYSVKLGMWMTVGWHPHNVDFNNLKNKQLSTVNKFNIFYTFTVWLIRYYLCYNKRHLIINKPLFYRHDTNLSLPSPSLDLSFNQLNLPYRVHYLHNWQYARWANCDLDVLPTKISHFLWTSDSLIAVKL